MVSPHVIVILSTHIVEDVGEICSRGDVERHEESMMLISKRLFAGRTVIHVYGKSNPGDGFEPVQPDLEDAYFTSLRATRIVN